MTTPEKPLIIKEIEREIVDLKLRLAVVEKAVEAYLKRHG